MRDFWRGAMIVALLMNFNASAETWPAKPIRALIPFGAGSATDVIPRAVFDPLGAELGQPIVIENRPGAGSVLAMGAVIRSEPDGYTILANSSAHTLAQWVVPDFPFDVSKDLSAALMFGQNANVLAVLPDRGWKTAADLVATAKAKPGSITYGSAGVGTSTHIAAEKFRLSAGFEGVHVPYKGGAEALTDLLGGRIDFYYCPISTALPLLREKRLVALAVSTPTRASDLADVPTSIEAGYPNSDLVIWYGVFMPSKTPRDIIEKFHAAATKVLATATMQQRLKQLALDPMPLSPAEMDAFVAKELVSNGELIKTIMPK